MGFSEHFRRNRNSVTLTYKLRIDIGRVVSIGTALYYEGGWKPATSVIPSATNPSAGLSLKAYALGNNDC